MFRACCCLLLTAICVAYLQGCATSRGDELAFPERAKAIPPAREIVVVTPEPIGHETIARYGGEVGAMPSGEPVTPVIRLMETPQVSPGIPWYVPYSAPPGPRSAVQAAHEPYSHAVERAVAGALIGGIVGAQFGSGGGRHVGAGVGAAAGTMIGLGASDNPCATPHGGTIAGAALGGVLGNQIGSGSGRSAATALGAMLGALAGTQTGATTSGCR